MEISKKIIEEKTYYHIYNRGTDKRKIFSNESDYKRFTLLLLLANSSTEVRIRNLLRQKKYNDIFLEYDVEHSNYVEIISWCLMPNHFHLLLSEKIEGGLPKFMKKLCTAYSMYFNKKYNRTGNLFQGKYKSKIIEDDVYLNQLIKYIHVNPLEIIDNVLWKKMDLDKGIFTDVDTRNIPVLKKYFYSSFLDYFTELDRVENKILSLDQGRTLVRKLN